METILSLSINYVAPNGERMLSIVLRRPIFLDHCVAIGDAIDIVSNNFDTRFKVKWVRREIKNKGASYKILYVEMDHSSDFLENDLTNIISVCSTLSALEIKDNLHVLFDLGFKVFKAESIREQLALKGLKILIPKEFECNIEAGL